MAGVIILRDYEANVNVGVKCLGVFVDGMGRVLGSGLRVGDGEGEAEVEMSGLGLGKRNVSGESENSEGKNSSSSGSDTVRAGEGGRVLVSTLGKEGEKSSTPAAEDKHYEHGVQQNDQAESAKRKGKEKQKDTIPNHHQSENSSENPNSNSNSNTPKVTPQMTPQPKTSFFRPILLDGFPLGYLPLAYRQNDKAHVLRDQARGIRTVLYNPKTYDSGW